MTRFDEDNMDMQTHSVGDIGNPITGELISREAVLGYLTMTNEALALRDAARAEGTTLVISLSEVKVFLDAMALEVTALPQAWPAAPEAGEVERLRADIENGARDYCALMDRHDALVVRLAKVGAERDAIGAAMVEACANAAIEALRGPMTDEDEIMFVAEYVASAVLHLANPSSKATLDKLIADAVQAALAAQGEPVAWAESYDGGNFFNTVSMTQTRHHTFPLYAHPAPASAGVTVKPLVWSDDEFPSECFQAGDYAIWKEAGKYQLHFWSIVEGEPHLTLEAAQSAAWEHHRARVLAALTTAQIVSEGGAL